MAEFKELLPTVTGPGAFLVSLIFIALILTSEESQDLAFTWNFAVALVAISFPISVLITQIFHAYFIKFGYRKKNWGEKYINYRKNMNKLDAMFDYLCWEKNRGEKGWFVIQKKAWAYNLFSMLRVITVGFSVIYTIILFLNGVYRYFSTWWGGSCLSISSSNFMCEYILDCMQRGVGNIYAFRQEDD